MWTIYIDFLICFGHDSLGFKLILTAHLSLTDDCVLFAFKMNAYALYYASVIKIDVCY